MKCVHKLIMNAFFIDSRAEIQFRAPLIGLVGPEFLFGTPLINILGHEIQIQALNTKIKFKRKNSSVIIKELLDDIEEKLWQKINFTQ